MRRSFTKRNYSKLKFTLVQDCDTQEEKLWNYSTLVYYYKNTVLYLQQYICLTTTCIIIIMELIYYGLKQWYYTENMWRFSFVCFFVCFLFLSHSKICHSFRDITIHNRWQAANVDLCSALMAIEQWVLFNVPTTVLQ